MTAETTKRSLPRRTVLAMAVGAAGCAVAAQSIPTSAHAAELVDLEVVDRETGQGARVWRHAGRLFVAGRPGARYSLRVTNNTPGRVLVVMSVDGVNILTGETAAYGQRGYVFGAYQSYEVSGWRKSDTEVAAFTFAPLPRSYAARTGRPGDVGVIGLAVFTERVYAPPLAVGPSAESSARALPAPPSTARSAPAPQTAAPASPAARDRSSDEFASVQRRSEKLGTGHGAREWSAVTTVPFERATSYPQLIQPIEYDSHDNLVASGVIPPPRAPSRRPQPFPGGGGYVPDPPRGR